MAEMRASPVVNPRLLSIAKVLQDLQGPMGQVIPGTDVNPFKLLPAAQSVENWAYGNSPFSDYASVTNRRLPVVKTGREGEVRDLADVALMGASLPAAAKGVTRGANFLGDVMTQAVTRNPNATSMMALDEIARMTRAPQIAPNPAMVTQPAKSDLGFYSQLEAATLPLQNKGSGEQYLAQISKTPGVKPEELQWTGLDEFLRSKPSVTKAEIQDYLNANRVDVQEVRLDSSKTVERDNLKAASFRALQQVDEMIPGLSQLDRANLTTFWAPGAQAGNAADLAKIQALNLSEDQMRVVMDYGAAVNRQRDFIESTDGFMAQPKFSSYTLPGGENYREILLTLPSGPRQTKFEVFDPSTQRAVPFETKEEAVAFANQDPTRSSVVAEVDVSKPEYRSSHFDQPNILAHMRANDRVVDGKNTLFIEEIQSDWHQAGRKKGYGPQTETTHEAYYMTPDGQRVSLGFGKTQEEAAAAVDPGWQGIVDVKFDTQTKKVGEGVPDAPFKTSWHELALKRAIQEASEKGYDQIAFTTGKTQAERYDLSKQVDELLYKKNPDGTYRLSAQVRGRGQSFGDSIPESKLEEYVGKEVAKSITQGSGKDVNLGGPGSFTQPRDDWKSMSGLDLQVGGEGMKGFYDNILPKSLDKLGKKFGAKVTKSNMDGTEVWTMPITPEMRKSVTTKGQPLFAIPAIGTGAIAAEAYRQNQQDNFGY